MEKHGQQVQFVYRHFPLSAIHPYADQVALYAEVAAVSDKFWEFHELAFANQAQWAELKSSPEVEQFFQEKMVTLGVDKSQFQERIKASSARDAVRSDVADATKLGVDSTPTFFVNGRKVSAPELISSVEALLQ
jgi:protein-disulfide isomerase